MSDAPARMGTTIAIEQRAPSAAWTTRTGSLLRRRVPLSQLQAALILTLMAALPLAKTVDPDFWWHLRTGELILHSGIPRHDSYSWTAAGNAWSAHEWLSEAIIYTVQLTLGYAGNVALFGGATAAALAVMYGLARRGGAGSRVLTALLLLAAITFAPFATVRPQVFTWLFFALTVSLLERSDAGDETPIWLLPPLFALWANVHLGFVYGLMAVGLWAAARVVDRASGRATDLRATAAITVTCIFATFLNPSGPGILAYPLRYVHNTGPLNLVYEWQRPSIFDPLMAPYFVAFAVLLVAIVAKQRPRIFLVLLSLSVMALSLQAVRNVPFVALMVMPVAGAAASRRWSAASQSSDSRVGAPITASVLVLGAFIVAMMGVGVHLHGALWEPDDEGYPHAGTVYVESHLMGRKLFNEYTWGGYVIEESYPEVRVFIDGRTDFYGSALLDDYVTIARVDPGWDAQLNRYGVDVLLLRKDSPLARRVRSDSRWRDAFDGPIESVFVRDAGSVVP